jgi:signal transduction histidine kinase
MGVANMGERAALVGGELEIESAPGAGATIYVRVPLGGGDVGGGGV